MTDKNIVDIAELQQKANEGDAQAQFDLANCYYEGNGVEKNNDRAFDYYQEASLAGHTLAKIKIGEMYFCTGATIIFRKEATDSYSEDDAFDFFTKSIDCGYLEAFRRISEGYCSCEFNDSYKRAIGWYEKHAKEGYVEANYWLAEICTRYADFFTIGYGTEIDGGLGFELLLKASKYGSEKASQQALLRLCINHKFAKSDGERVFIGFKCLSKEAESIEIKKLANSFLSDCYAEGFGTERNIELAEYHSQLGLSQDELVGIPNHLLHLPPSSQLAKENLDEILGIHFKKNDSDSAKEFLDHAFENPKGIEKGFKKISLRVIEQAEKLREINRELEEKNQQLQQAKNELEDMMSMFAHKFRTPLDAIIYNTTHDNQIKLYTEAAQTMRGLLNIFSIISTDSEILKDKIKQDRQGSGRLATVFSKTLDMILLHLLSVSGAEKIQQHYMAYAKAHGQCDALVSYKTWCEEYFELEQVLQAEWEQSFALLLNQSATLEQRLAWLEQHFFKLEIIGVEQIAFQFKEYGVTESFITILLNEILVNAFKYYSSASKQSVVVEWAEREGYQVLACRNPSIRSERTIIKGSHKGHSFLSALARKTGSTFTKPVPQDEFVVEFGIPNELLISK